MFQVARSAVDHDQPRRAMRIDPIGDLAGLTAAMSFEIAAFITTA